MITMGFILGITTIFILKKHKILFDLENINLLRQKKKL